MCKVKKGKLIGHWRQNKQSQEFMTEHSRHIGIPICELIETSRARGDIGGGTWMHRALYLAI
jgi:hypothetical protein